MPKLNLLAKLGASTLLLSLASVFAFNSPASLQAQETQNNTTIEDLEEEPSDAVGEQVTVRGEVNEVEPGISFEIAEEGFLEGEEVLVINATGEMLPEMPDEDLDLQVTGEVGTFLTADIESYNSLYDYDFDPNLYVDYDNRPVIFAESVTLSPGIEQISETPDYFYSKEVAIEGEVTEIKSDLAFTLTEDDFIGGNEMLIVNVTGEPIPSEDERVVVTGMVRPYVSAEFERDYDLTWDLDVQREIEAEYTQQPVLVVDSIYPIEDDGLLE
jgi:hypothetical protein